MAKYDYVCPACGQICDSLQELDEHQFNSPCEDFERELSKENKIQESNKPALMLTPDQINWKFSGHITQYGQGIRAERDAKLGLAKEIVTRINESGIATGKAKTYYFISGDKREFLTEQELCDAYNELNSITK